MRWSISLGRRLSTTSTLDGPLRTRFAPSPTGFMHLGGLRTALFNYLIARKTEGEFLIRIEDTDQARTVPGSKENLIDVLKWAKINSSVGFPIVEQSKRLGIYSKYADQLLSEGKAYRCYCSKERLEGLRTSSRSGYDRTCRNLAEAQDISMPHVVRLKIPSGSSRSSFFDQVFGHISIDLSTIDDVIIMKSDGFPTYHFANVIDDYEAGVNLVMRGQEWLPSTPLHTLLYDLFGWRRPAFAHLPLLVKPDGSKLSKRQGDAFVDFYRRLGYTPEALCNFVAFLGWSPSGPNDEVMSMDQLINAFSINAINKAESRLDVNKLNWLNRKHLGLEFARDPERFVNELRILLKRDLALQELPSFQYIQSVIDVIKDRIFTLQDIPRLCAYFFKTPNYQTEFDRTLLPLDRDTTLELLTKLKNLLVSDSEKTGKEIEAGIEQIKADASHIITVKIMMTFRLSLTCTKVGASLLDTAALLGKREVIKRLSLAIEVLETSPSLQISSL